MIVVGYILWLAVFLSWTLVITSPIPAAIHLFKEKKYFKAFIILIFCSVLAISPFGKELFK